LDTKLNDLLLSGDSPIGGPQTARALREFAAEPDPQLPTKAEGEKMMASLAVATAQAKVSESEAQARLEMYCVALQVRPADALRSAFVGLVQTAKFLPTPSEVRTAGLRAGSQRRYAKSRAQYLAWKHEQEWKEPQEAVRPEELQALMTAHTQETTA